MYVTFIKLYLKDYQRKRIVAILLNIKMCCLKTLTIATSREGRSDLYPKAKTIDLLLYK